MKRINKRACQKYLLTAETPDPGHGLFLVRSIKFVICTSIRTIDRRRILVLHLYPAGGSVCDHPVPAFTVFQASDSFVTYVHGTEVKTRWRTSMLCNLDRQNYYFSKRELAFYSREDEQRVFSF